MLRLLSLVLIIATFSAKAEIEAEIPWGAEVVTGYRTDLIERGFQLGENVIDVQVQTEIVFNDEWSLGFGAFHATASGVDEYEETSSFVEIVREYEQMYIGWHLGYRDVQSTIWRNGLETGPMFMYRINQNISVGFRYLYDGGASGSYAEARCSWSHPLNDKSFLSINSTAGYAIDYYGRDGLHDLSARLGWTYNLASNISLTPFLGGSIGIHDDAADQIYSGLWFEVTF